MKILGWIAFSVLYWFLALGFALGAMLGRCEPPKSGCSPVTGDMVFWSAVVLYGLIILASIVLKRRRAR